MQMVTCLGPFQQVWGLPFQICSFCRCVTIQVRVASVLVSCICLTQLVRGRTSWIAKYGLVYSLPEFSNITVYATHTMTKLVCFSQDPFGSMYV